MFLKIIYVSSSQIILGKLHLFDSVDCNCKCSCWKLNCLFYCDAFLAVTRCNQLLISCFFLLIFWQPDDQQALQKGLTWPEIGNNLEVYFPSNDTVIVCLLKITNPLCDLISSQIDFSTTSAILKLHFNIQCWNMSSNTCWAKHL